MDHKAKILPQIVKRFLAAANRWDAGLAAACFTPRATIHDEDRAYEGREAIQTWVAETSLRYRPTLTPLRSFAGKDVMRAEIAVSGQFPGSPVTLDYELRLRHGKIFTLTIV